jgi:hypothetical protein
MIRQESLNMKIDVKDSLNWRDEEVLQKGKKKVNTERKECVWHSEATEKEQVMNSLKMCA